MQARGMTPVDARPARTGGVIGYLPGLDGLRAVSVLAVIAYHLDLSWAPGGYLGVEVFFVVSGYLITLLALDEDRRTGAIDRVAFWGRRARRLLPAVVVLVAAVMAWTALAAGMEELRRFRGDGLASLLYVQNWHAIVTEQPYFATFGRPPPLRHLWSLAIEEQFYLLWPLFLPFSLRRLGRRATVAITLLAGAASVLAMLALADIAAPERAYYGTDTRAFGILVGCALAFGWQPRRFRSDIAAAPKRTLTAAGLVAAATLAWQFGHRSEFDPWTYPWGFALVDLCSVALIVTTTHPGSPLRLRFGSPALAAVGRRSYSLYLWHWPVIVFTRPGADWPLQGAPALLARLALIWLLAEASYRFVEQPFRQGLAQPRIGAFVRSARTRPRRAVATAAVSVAALALVGVVVAAPAPEQAVAVGAPVTIPAAPTERGVSSAADPVTSSTTTTTPAPTTTTRATVPPTTAAPSTTAAPETTTTAAAAPAPPPTTTATPPVVPDVTIIGESVTVGAAPELKRLYGPRIQIDAVESRSFSDGAAVIEALAAAGRLTPTVVVHMGNNGAVPEGGLDRIATAIGPDRRTVFVTVRVPRRWEAQVNDAISRHVAQHDNSVLADWYALSGAEPEVLGDDGVHLTPAGRRRYSELILSVTG